MRRPAPNRVEIYRNLHTGNYSVRAQGAVIDHLDEVLVERVIFRVQPAGHARVMREKSKNVHAFVVGDKLPFAPVPDNAVPIRYNPYEKAAFRRLDTGEDIYSAVRVWLTSKGAFAVFG